MKKNCIIKVRVDTELKNQMDKAITRFNESGVGEITQTHFLRMAIRRLSTDIMGARKLTLKLE